MRLLITIVLALFGAAGLALLLREDPGYALLSIGNITIETSVAVLVILLLLMFTALYFLLRLLAGLLHAPAAAAYARRRWQRRRSSRLLTLGLLELLEGRWKKAEVALLKGVTHSQAPVLHYLGAARAAHKLKEYARRDQHLNKTDDLTGREAFAGKLARAELLLDNHAAGAALHGLERLYKTDPHHPHLVELLARCYQQLDEWGKLKDLLPALSKYAAPDEAWFKSLRLQTYTEALERASHKGSVEDLRTLWKHIPEALRAEESLLLAYAGHLRDHQAVVEAETLLRQALNKHWSDKLVVGYGELGRGNFNEQLHVAEGWLKQHGEDPYLLLTCGRLAKRGFHMGKARGYLEQSARLSASPDAFHELGEVLDEMGDKDGARQCYQRALRLLSGRLEEKEGIALPPPDGDALPVADKGAVLVKETKPITQNPQPSAS